MYLPPILLKISYALKSKGASAVLVGGAVRDMLLGIPVKDYDIEVYGLQKVEELEAILGRFGSVNCVGKSFGVVKLKSGMWEFDFSFPRRECKSGKGHRGFDVSVDGTLDFKTAARRRDFTINAIGYEIQTCSLIDPFGGVEDIQKRYLRHIDADTFVEDPLRVYRAVQFAARFGFKVAHETAVLCKKMVAGEMLDELPKERVYEEWKKLFLKADKPSVGLELMREWGITARYFPELHALIGVPQDPKWHPEGDVWVHTMMVVDAMAEIMSREQGVGSREDKERLKLLFAALCHDFGKPATTTIEYEDGKIEKWHPINKSVSLETHTNTLHSSLFTLHSKIRAIGHEKAGLEPTKSFLYRLTNEHDFIENILPLVEHHLKPSQFYAQGAKAGAIRRLATKVNIEALVYVAKADFLGRTTPKAATGRYEAGEWLLDEAKKLAVEHSPVKPLLQGRDLIALGLVPSPQFGAILQRVYEAQMDGKITTKEEALSFVKNL
ncbi:tRNA nucleotidyltransferase [hydrothermal vent metagenome]|uniref:tRNA nucleotidyltransferase n=1 Tax=hydrothermal vent metagenome TaxID=652676 RepID=A0A1W1E937_9ZZZZ